MIQELEYDVLYDMARARILAKEAAVAVTDQAILTAADGINTAEKNRILADEVAIDMMDQAILTAADRIFMTEKAR